MMTFKTLAIRQPDDLIFGVAPHPLVTRRGVSIGGGNVIPELNFTLPTMMIRKDTMPEVCAHYKMIVDGALKRAAELNADGVLLEFETLPPMTENPEWGARITEILLKGMDDAQAATGLKSALRLTPNDTREMVRPPRMNDGDLFEAMIQTFEAGAKLGADMLSIESVGGKEVHDEALLNCNIKQVIFSLCVMGVRDMTRLWTRIVEIGAKYGSIPAGDTACGFGNTAMVLAEQKMIPRVFAAVVRAVSAVRSLVAYECGAKGPGKDCGYENLILKAITGYPMAMEGKSAAGAHLSPVGNIAAIGADVWSNESIQNIKLLGGMAPTVGMEQLIYDCRLMNAASSDGKSGALQLRNWLTKSDALLDPQAYVLSPASTIAIAQAIVSAPTYYEKGLAAARTAANLLKSGAENEGLAIDKREMRYLNRIIADLESMPDTETALISEMMTSVDVSKFRPADYALPEPAAV